MTFEEKIKDIIQNYNLGNFLKAESLAKSLLTKNVKDYQLCNIYGLILLALKKTEGAISYFQKSINIKEDYFEGHYNLLKAFYNLKKYDKFSMAHSIESRFPFLDYRLVKFCFSLPNKFKIKNGLTKKILRDVMRNKLPEKIVNQVKKGDLIQKLTISTKNMETL